MRKRYIGVIALICLTIMLLTTPAGCIDSERQVINTLQQTVFPVYGDDISDRMRVIAELAADKARAAESQEQEAKLAEPAEPAGTHLGVFRISHYCPCSKCNGPWSTTALGTPLTVGTTIAVDRSVIPLGSAVYIEGYGDRIAQDTGGAIKGNRIDILVSSHDEAVRMGVVYRDVYLK